MKILLFGEFSGLHNNLKAGLVELGHDVTIASGHDGYKMIMGDVNLDPTLPSFFGKIEARIKPFARLKDFRDYDVVQLINPFFPNAKYFPRLFFYSLLKKRNKKFFLLAAGSDAYFWRNGRKNLRYGPFNENLKYDLKAKTFYMESDKSFLYNTKMVEISDGVIPVMYEYEVSYKNCSKRLNTIPLPINTNAVKYQDNNVRSKLVIFHGLTRYGFKGTKHVIEAFEELSKKYPNDLELIIDGQMPIVDYLKIMEKSNVVIDQVNSFSAGMNALYALAMGKVVLGGAEPEGLKSLGVSDSPIINVTPTKTSIINAVEKLLENRDSISTQGLDGRKFIEEFHCHVKVAKRYIKTWAS